MKEITPIDIAFLNEAELSFLNLLEYHNKNTSIDSLSMTYLRESASDFIKIEVDGRPKHLDLEIIPAYDLIKVEDIQNMEQLDHGQPLEKMQELEQYYRIEVVGLNALSVM